MRILSMGIAIVMGLTSAAPKADDTPDVVKSAAASAHGAVAFAACEDSVEPLDAPVTGPRLEGIEPVASARPWVRAYTPPTSDVAR